MLVDLKGSPRQHVPEWRFLRPFSDWGRADDQFLGILIHSRGRASASQVFERQSHERRSQQLPQRLNADLTTALNKHASALGLDLCRVVCAHGEYGHRCFELTGAFLNLREVSDIAHLRSLFLLARSEELAGVSAFYSKWIFGFERDVALWRTSSFESHETLPDVLMQSLAREIRDAFRNRPNEWTPLTVLLAFIFGETSLRDRFSSDMPLTPAPPLAEVITSIVPVVTEPVPGGAGLETKLEREVSVIREDAPDLGTASNTRERLIFFAFAGIHTLLIAFCSLTDAKIWPIRGLSVFPMCVTYSFSLPLFFGLSFRFGWKKSIWLIIAGILVTGFAVWITFHKSGLDWGTKSNILRILIGGGFAFTLSHLVAIGSIFKDRKGATGPTAAQHTSAVAYWKAFSISELVINTPAFLLLGYVTTNPSSASNPYSIQFGSLFVMTLTQCCAKGLVALALERVYMFVVHTGGSPPRSGKRSFAIRVIRLWLRRLLRRLDQLDRYVLDLKLRSSAKIKAS